MTEQNSSEVSEKLATVLISVFPFIFTFLICAGAWSVICHCRKNDVQHARRTSSISTRFGF
jgi:hypothetical protein